KATSGKSPTIHSSRSTRRATSSFRHEPRQLYQRHHLRHPGQNGYARRGDCVGDWCRIGNDDMTDDELNWLAEHACRAARPAIVNERVKGWLFRQSGGRIRQINSVNPLPETRGDAALTIAEAEIFYS